MQLFEINKALEENKEPNIYTMLEKNDNNSILNTLDLLETIHGLKRRGITEVMLEQKKYTNPYISFEVGEECPSYLRAHVEKVYRLLGFLNLIDKIQHNTKTACNLHAIEITI